MPKRNIILIILTSAFILGSQLAYGAGVLPAATGAATPGCVSPDPNISDATYCGNYEINDFVSLGIIISKWVLGIVGSLSLLMFIYGGFMFLISTGSAEKIKKATQIITAAVIGLIIVFSSYLIIKFVLSSMGLNWEGKIEKPKQTTLMLTDRLV